MYGSLDGKAKSELDFNQAASADKIKMKLKSRVLICGDQNGLKFLQSQPGFDEEQRLL